MDRIRSWFYLKTVPGVGNLIGKRLIDRFKSPQSIFQARDKDLLGVEGVSRRHVSAIRSHKMPEGVEAELDLAHRKGYQIVTLTDAGYPRLLRQIPDPPPFLYVSGRLDDSPLIVAVVGSRNATAYGLHSTRSLSASLASLNVTIVSGMARGIDTAAHRGALAAGGTTIAVLGSGLERIYPAENQSLFDEITERGAVVSEFPLHTKPEAHNFPVRNRIISGMCLGTVVVEASRKSGSLITARLAAEQNREVFAVPGSIQSFKSSGTHTLIKQGAKLVEHARDVIEELAPMVPPERPAEDDLNDTAKAEQVTLTADEDRVYDALGPYSVHIDDLARSLSMESGRLSGVLLQLEIKGLVEQLPGKWFTVAPRTDVKKK
jgi:DNA processing protein